MNNGLLHSIEQPGCSMKLTLAHESGVRFEGWGVGAGLTAVVTWDAWQAAGCPSVLAVTLHASEMPHPDKH